MTLTLLEHPMPLRTNDDGVVLVGDSRVPIDTVVEAYHDGASPEETVRRYPSLRLADVYAAIGYYLANRRDFDAWLAERRSRATAVQIENEARFDPTGVRERLLARRAGSGQSESAD